METHTDIWYTAIMACIFYRIPGAELAADENETARYLGYRKSDPPDTAVQALIHNAAKEMLAVLTPQAVYDTFDIARPEQGVLTFAGLTLRSADLSRNLEGCNSIVIFAATIGTRTDSLIKKIQCIDSAKAAIMQATGAMFIESFVESLNNAIRKQVESEGKSTRPRYSPGYGDVPLSVQRHIFSVLPCTRIGLTLMETLIMAPEKSVTAFIGIKEGSRTAAAF